MFSAKLNLMYSSVWGTTNVGVDGEIVQVETHVSPGIPSLKIVGLTNKTIQEASERVLAAIRFSGVRLKAKKIRVNLAPSDILKRGSGLDLPIAIGILTANFIPLNQRIKNKRIFAFGELGLNGAIRATSGLFQFFEQTNRHTGKKLIFTPQNTNNVEDFFPKIQFYRVSTLKEVIKILTGKNSKKKLKKNVASAYKFNKKNIQLHNSSRQKIKTEQTRTEFSIDDIKGQKQAKRALLLAATGHHHLLLGGPIGTGKSMLASTITTIMPKLTVDERYDIAKILSTENALKTNPIHIEYVNKSTTRATLIGGGNVVVPGKITMAHNGILLIDELAELDKKLINLLREPLSKNTYNITRRNRTIQLPCNFLLIATTNLCSCGNAGSDTKQCVCTNRERLQYVKRIPEAIMNRIDLFVRIHPERLGQDQKLNQNLETQTCKNPKSNLQSEPSKNKSSHTKEIAYKWTGHKNQRLSRKYQKIANRGKQIQLNRYKSENYSSNSALPYPHLKKYCHITTSAKTTLRRAIQHFNLNGRDYVKILRVALTISDIEQKYEISETHILEALSYRTNTLYT